MQGQVPAGRVPARIQPIDAPAIHERSSQRPPRATAALGYKDKPEMARSAVTGLLDHPGEATAFRFQSAPASSRLP